MCRIAPSMEKCVYEGSGASPLFCRANKICSDVRRVCQGIPVIGKKVKSHHCRDFIAFPVIEMGFDFEEKRGHHGRKK